MKKKTETKKKTKVKAKKRQASDDPHLVPPGHMVQYADEQQGWDVLTDEQGSLVIRSMNHANGFSIGMQINKDGDIMLTTGDGTFHVQDRGLIIVSKRPDDK